ncbi:hypothetical protein ACFV9C_25185 [Kribbella sp. NPDC059898]|uniref:hypothetical protein n=1 Tax=Kribbella sp. NPDC059898 TaxID=3346995 RepID=UPI0036595EEA
MTFTEPEQAVGDHDQTTKRLSEWDEGQKVCRGEKRHKYKTRRVYVYGQDPDKVGTRMTIIKRCRICRCVEVEADFVRSPRGLRQVTKWYPKYFESKDGVPYLLDKGSARLDDGDFEELNADLYLGQSLTFVEETD